LQKVAGTAGTERGGLASADLLKLFASAFLRLDALGLGGGLGVGQRLQRPRPYLCAWLRLSCYACD